MIWYKESRPGMIREALRSGNPGGYLEEYRNVGMVGKGAQA